MNSFDDLVARARGAGITFGDIDSVITAYSPHPRVPIFVGEIPEGGKDFVWRKQTVSNNPEVGVSWESISEAAERLKASIAEQLLFGGLPTAVVDSPLIVKQTIAIIESTLVPPGKMAALGNVLHVHPSEGMTVMMRLRDMGLDANLQSVGDTDDTQV